MEKTDFTDSIQRTLDGDMEAFKDLYDSSFPYVNARCRCYFTKEADIEDAMQETYLKAYRKLDTLSSPGAFLSWIQKIAENTCLDMIKYRQRHASEELLPHATDDEAEGLDKISAQDYRREVIPEMTMNLNETRILVQRMLESLPPMQRACMVLYAQDRSYKEMAELLQIPEGTAKSNVNYGKKKLKAMTLELERAQDIRLHSVAPLPLFFQFLYILYSAQMVDPVYMQSLFGRIMNLPQLGELSLRVQPAPEKNTINGIQKEERLAEGSESNGRIEGEEPLASKQATAPDSLSKGGQAKPLFMASAGAAGTVPKAVIISICILGVAGIVLLTKLPDKSVPAQSGPAYATTGIASEASSDEAYAYEGQDTSNGSTDLPADDVASEESRGFTTEASTSKESVVEADRQKTEPISEEDVKLMAELADWITAQVGQRSFSVNDTEDFWLHMSAMIVGYKTEFVSDKVTIEVDGTPTLYYAVNRDYMEKGAYTVAYDFDGNLPPADGYFFIESGDDYLAMAVNALVYGSRLLEYSVSEEEEDIVIATTFERYDTWTGNSYGSYDMVITLRKNEKARYGYSIVSCIYEE